MIYTFLFILESLQYISAISFQPVRETCKYWDPVSSLQNGAQFKFHCILDEDHQLGIVNTTWKLLEKGYCPYFNRHSEQIGSFLCNESDGSCPPSEIRSYQATQFSGCIKEKRYREETSKSAHDIVFKQPDNQAWFPITAGLSSFILGISLFFNVVFLCRSVAALKSIKRERNHFRPTTVYNLKHVTIPQPKSEEFDESFNLESTDSEDENFKCQRKKPFPILHGYPEAISAQTRANEAESADGYKYAPLRVDRMTW